MIASPTPVRVRLLDETVVPSGEENPCAEQTLEKAEPCLLPFPPPVRTWKDWIDNWPELPEIQRAWHETYPLKKTP